MGSLPSKKESPESALTRSSSSSVHHSVTPSTSPLFSTLKRRMHSVREFLSSPFSTSLPPLPKETLSSCPHRLSTESSLLSESHQTSKHNVLITNKNAPSDSLNSTFSPRKQRLFSINDHLTSQPCKLPSIYYDSINKTDDNMNLHSPSPLEISDLSKYPMNSSMDTDYLQQQDRSLPGSSEYRTSSRSYSVGPIASKQGIFLLLLNHSL